MRRIFFTILAAVMLLLIPAIVSADEMTSAGHFLKTGNTVYLRSANYELGDATHKIKKLTATDIVTGGLTFTSITVSGDIDSTGTAIDWDLKDNNASALSFDTAGKTGLLNFSTLDGTEGITMSGTLGVTGAISGNLTGNASTASALAADPADCAANKYANAISAAGALTCASISDADVPNNITIDYAAKAGELNANPTDCSAGQYANAIAATGNLTCSAIADGELPAALTGKSYNGLTLTSQAVGFTVAGGTTSKTLTVDDNITASELVDYAYTPLSITNGAISLGTVGIAKGGTNITTYTLGDLLYASATDVLSKLTGNTAATKMFLSQTGDGANSAAPAWATLTDADIPNDITIDYSATSGSALEADKADYLSADPTDCSTNQFANAINAYGTLSCASVGDADVPNNITIDYAAASGTAGTASALAADPTDCSSNQFATTIGANGNLTCASIADADVPNTITIDLATLATNSYEADKADYLSADPADCSSNQFANAINAYGTLSCSGIADADIPNSITIDYATNAGTATSALDADKADYLSADPADCSSNQFANAINAYGTLSCAALADADIPNDITVNTAGALAADPNNCSAGQAAGGITAAGVAEACIDPIVSTEIDTLSELETIMSSINIIAATEIDTSSELATILTDETGTGAAVFATDPVFSTSVALPQGASPTVDAAGEIAIDTTDDQLIYYGGAARVIPYKKQMNFTLESPTDADNFLIGKMQDGITITDIHCIVDPADGSESAVIDVQERDATADNPASADAAITCDNDGAEDDGSLTNGVIDANDWMSIDIGAITGTVTQVSVSIFYTINAE